MISRSPPPLPPRRCWEYLKEEWGQEHRTDWIALAPEAWIAAVLLICPSRALKNLFYLFVEALVVRILSAFPIHLLF
jgi:hypothetical protein